MPLLQFTDPGQEKNFRCINTYMTMKNQTGHLMETGFCIHFIADFGTPNWPNKDLRGPEEPSDKSDHHWESKAMEKAYFDLESL